MTTSVVLASADTPPKGQLRADRGSVSVGGHVRLTGRLRALSGGSATIQFQPAGEHTWRPQRHVGLGPAGGFSVPVHPHQTGLWRASTASGRTTGSTLVRVRSAVEVAPTRRNINVGNGTTIRGHVLPQDAGRKVVVRIGGDELKARTNHAGRFQVDWHGTHPGTYKVSAVAHGDKLAAGSRAGGGPINVYRSSMASWYGPGGATACGVALTSSTMGVAHRTLPCGTKLKMRHGNHVVTVRVIDRGPYVSGREWDLAPAVKNALGCGDLCVVQTTK